NDRQLTALLKMAQPLMSVRAKGGWSNNASKLPCVNGIVDLTTGITLIPEPTEHYNYALPIIFNAESQSDFWINFLNTVFKGDVEYIDFIQLCAGYSMTAETREQVAFFCLGNGSNGKGKFLHALCRCLGDLSDWQMASTFEKGLGKADTAFLAELEGKRLVVVDEIDETTKFDMSLIKRFVGGESLKAKKNYLDPKTFRPLAKLWLT